MRIVVCVRQGLDGELGPFDAAAYEAALQMKGAEVTLLSMGAPRTADLLSRLSRLGAKEAVLLSDPLFAGADTLATAYTLSLAIARLQPDLVFCGRQTLVGDTAQTGAMLAALADLTLVSGVMATPREEGDKVFVATREGERQLSLPALLTFERIHALRLPSLRSRAGEVKTVSLAALGADPTRTGLAGSPTRVIATAENEGGRRRCRFISPAELDGVVRASLGKRQEGIIPQNGCENKLPLVLSVGEAPLTYAKAVAERVTVLRDCQADAVIEAIRRDCPAAVLFGTDTAGRECAARVAAVLGLGLCADCTALETDGQELFMIRPAQAGSIMAKIKSRTRPALATVRTLSQESAEVVVAAGIGAAASLDRVRALAAHFSASLAASRRAVDEGLLPYDCQVGLTGKAVSPAVYIAVGISGAVHHVVGMSRAGTVIAINPDKNAPIFDYADYGIIARAEDLVF